MVAWISGEQVLFSVLKYLDTEPFLRPEPSRNEEDCDGIERVRAETGRKTNPRRRRRRRRRGGETRRGRRVGRRRRGASPVHLSSRKIRHVGRPGRRRRTRRDAGGDRSPGGPRGDGYRGPDRRLLATPAPDHRPLGRPRPTAVHADSFEDRVAAWAGE